VFNGRLVSSRPRGNRTTWVYDQPEPTSPYLATLHVGRYEPITMAKQPVLVQALAPPELHRQVRAAFARQTEMLEVFSTRFGPYPFAAGYTVVVSPDELEVPLEAQGQSIFGTNHLDGESERLIAHELAHQWFGNSVTAARWHDVWLHEGFACYAEWIWSEDSGGPSAQELAEEHHGLLRELPQDLLLGDPGARDLFDDRVYKRGALTLHALRGELGDAAFFRLLRRWASTHQHATATTEDFIALAEKAAGVPLGDLFRDWLRRRPLPPLSPAAPARRAGRRR
jgi:aminopeptidase N